MRLPKNRLTRAVERKRQLSLMEKALREIPMSSVTADRNKLFGELLKPREVNTMRKHTAKITQA